MLKVSSFKFESNFLLNDLIRFHVNKKGFKFQIDDE